MSAAVSMSNFSDALSAIPAETLGLTPALGGGGCSDADGRSRQGSEVAAKANRCQAV
jgi:hypothetical protein